MSFVIRALTSNLTPSTLTTSTGAPCGMGCSPSARSADHSSPPICTLPWGAISLRAMPCLPGQALHAHAHGGALGAQGDGQDDEEDRPDEQRGADDERDRDALEGGHAGRIEQHQRADDKRNHPGDGQRAVGGRFDIQDEEDEGHDQEEDAEPVDRQDAQAVDRQAEAAPRR